MRTHLVQGIIMTLVGHTCSSLSDGGEAVTSGRPKRQAATTRRPPDDLWQQCADWEGTTRRPINPSLRAVVPEGYDPYILPVNPDGGPLPIYISAKVRDIQKIDEQNMEVTIEWYLRLFWRDPGLTPPANLSDGQWQNIAPDITEYVWLPTTYIDHAKEITKPTLLVRPESFRMENNGLIRYSMSVTTRMSCPMDFTAYPFDHQVCYFRMESYQFTSKQVSYKWHNPVIERAKNIHLGQFDFDFYSVQQQNTSHTTGSFPLVMVEVVLKRRISYHLMNTFLPSGLFACVSWLTFLVPADQIPGRMVLTITTLLTLVSMFAAVRQESPKVSYAKAVDQWMIMCVVFVFLVLLEFTVVIRLYELGRRAAAREKATSSSPHHHDAAPANRSPSPTPPTRTSTAATTASHQPSALPSSHGIGIHASRRNPLKQQRVWEDGKEMAGGGEDLTRLEDDRATSGCFPRPIHYVPPPETLTPMFVKISVKRAGNAKRCDVSGDGETDWKSYADRVEDWSLRLYPLLFVLGNLGYWAYWLGRRR